MAAVQPLKYSGGAFGTLDGTADDTRFNSVGVGDAANGTRGTLNFGTAARAAVIQLNNSTGGLDFTSALVYTFNTALRGPDGSLTAPAFAFTSETNTGLRRVAAGDVRLVAAGVDVAAFLSTSRILTDLIDITTIRGGSINGRNDGSSLTLSGGAATNSQGLTFNTTASHTATTGTQEACRWTYTFAPTSGTAEFYGLNAAVTVNQTGGANGDYTALRVAVTETAAGGTNKRLVDFLVGGASKFKVDSAGLVTVAGRVTGVGAPTAASDATRADAAGADLVTTFIGIVQNAIDPNYATPGTSNANATEANSQARVPFPCVVRAMYIDAGTGPAADSIVFTLRKAGAGTAITATLAVSGTQASDVANTAAYAAGDFWALEANPGLNYTNSSCANVRITLAVTRL